MSGDDRIMVIGSGLGGLTAAVALQRRGKDVVLFEQFDNLLEVGAGITLNSNAITALREIALDKTVQEFKMWGSMTRKPASDWQASRWQRRPAIAV